MTVELVAADRGQIQWKMSASAREVQSFVRSEVDYVVFPTTPEWREAEELRESGKIQEAIVAYEKVVANPAAHHYPFPGNYTSLAMERLVHCYRDIMAIQKTAQQATAVREEFSNLPPDMRVVDPLNLAWMGVAEKEWEKVLAEASKVDPPSVESNFLKGRAFEGLDKKSEAIQAYAGVYTLNFGGNLLYTRSSMERSALLLSELGEPLREIELIAQLKLYRDLFGKGNLWEGASEKLNQLADGEIVTLGGPEGEMAEKPKPPSGEAGAVIEQKGSVVAASPASDRDYLLYQELPEKAFVLNRGKAPTKVEIVSGAAASDSGYLFDGTGGGLRLPGINGALPIVHIRMRFSPKSAEGALFELNEKGKGVAVYLEGGKLMVAWAAKGQPRMIQTIGDVSLDGQNLFDLRSLHKREGGGNLVVNLNGTRASFPLKKTGLTLSKGLKAAVGDSGQPDGGASIAGKKFSPFEGTIEHVSVGVGSTLKDVTDNEIARFGKVFHLFVPAGK